MSSSSDAGGRRAAVVIRGRQADVSLAPMSTDLRMASSVMRSIDPARIEQARLEGLAEGRAQGRIEGFDRGVDEGRAAAAAEAAEVRRRLGVAMGALEAGARQISDAQVLELHALEDAIVETALALAEAVLTRELELSSSPGREAIARAMAFAPAGIAAIAHVHPDDAATLTGALDDLPAEVAIVADAAVEPGGCILEAGDARVDAQLSTALARAAAVLRGRA